MKYSLRTALLALLIVPVACDGGGVTDPDPPPVMPSVPIQIPVLGQGVVAERYTSELWVQNGWGYTGTWGRRGATVGNALKIWDVTGNTPILRDSVLVSDATTLGDVQVSDDGRTLVVATEGGRGSIVVYDLTGNPGSPREIARHSSANTQSGVHTADLARVNGRLLAFLSITSRGTVVIVDLSNPASPRELSVTTTGTPFTHDVFVRDGLLFAAGWNGGTTLWDIGGAGVGGSPEAPARMATFPTVGGKAHNAWWFHDPRTGSKRYLFVGEEGPSNIPGSSSGDIHVVDIADPLNPREVAFFSIPGAGTHNFSVDEASGILYAAYYNGGVRALDIRGDLSACTAEQKDSRGRCDLGKMNRQVGSALSNGPFIWGVQLVGRDLYASDMVGGLWKLNVSSLAR